MRDFDFYTQGIGQMEKKLGHTMETDYVLAKKEMPLLVKACDQMREMRYRFEKPNESILPVLIELMEKRVDMVNY